MRLYRAKMISLAVAFSLPLSACASGQEGIGQAIGALALGGLCLAVVSDKDKSKCLLAAAAGFMIGGAIGRKMDERDRQKREAALRRTLDDEALWSSHRGAEPLPADAVNASPPPPSAPTVEASTPKAVTWINPDTQNSGRIEPLRTYVKSGPSKSQCRQYRETYFKKGEPITETKTVCQNAEGKWAE